MWQTRESFWSGMLCVSLIPRDEENIFKLFLYTTWPNSLSAENCSIGGGEMDEIRDIITKITVPLPPSVVGTVYAEEQTLQSSSG